MRISPGPAPTTPPIRDTNFGVSVSGLLLRAFLVTFIALAQTAVALGAGTDPDRDTIPEAFDQPPGRNPLVADWLVSAGGSHTCALDDGGVQCWGDNNEGQTTVPALLNPVAVSAGGWKKRTFLLWRNRTFLSWYYTPDGRVRVLCQAPTGSPRRLFLDPVRTQCLRCHNGPLLTNQAFHDIGTSRGPTGRDLGRFLGFPAPQPDPFNCLGPYSGVTPQSCEALRFADPSRIADQAGAFETPTPRGLEHTAPYFHDGRFETLDEVLDHYRNPPQGLAHELLPLTLTDAEARAVVRFLLALGA